MPAAPEIPRLDNARVAVIVEHKFIPEEIEAYRSGFGLLGAQVDFVSRIWYGDYKPESVTFYSDVDPLDSAPWESPHRLDVRRDITTVREDEYDAVIMAANYTSIRLRYADLPEDLSQFNAWEQVRAAPVPRFFAQAMGNDRIVKGALCHGLWILTPYPELLRGRRVVCNQVVMADILNCEAEVVMNADRVLTDGNLVTAYSKHEVVPFIAAIAQRMAALRSVR
jgi:protease I